MNKLNFLSGGGEMGKLIREKDWSKTSLGEPYQWPQSLRTVISILLKSKWPMFLFWGKDFVCFYNDAYRPSLGNNGKHPNMLGAKGEDGWLETWEIIKPIIDNVVDTGEANFIENELIPIYRNGKMEDVYWTYSHSPVTDESNSIAGIFVNVFETTHSVQNILNLEKINQQYYNNIMQAPVAMSVLRGENFIIEIANPLMLKLWRKNLDEVINKPVFEALEEARGQGLEELINHVYKTGEKFEANDRPFKVVNNGITEIVYISFVYDVLKDPNGTINGIVSTATDVTQQVVARKLIEESEKRFRKVADSAPVLIWMAGVDKSFYYFNKAWLNFTGKTLKKERGSGWTEGIYPDDIENCIKTYHTAFEKKEEFYIQYRLKRHDGEYRWVSDHGVPRYSSDNIFEGYIGASMDIHETVINSDILKQNEDKLKIVIDAGQLGIWEYDIKKEWGVFSKRYAQIFGYDSEDDPQLTRAKILTHLHPDDEPIRIEANNNVLSSGYLKYESRIIWQDGSIHWIDVNGKLFYDDDKKPSKMMGTIKDITNEKKYQQDLLEREEKFRLLADEMPQFVWTGDAGGNLNYFNKSVYKYSGLDESIISDGKWIEIVHPDDREQNIQLWTSAVTKGHDFAFEHRFKRHDGEYRWQLSRAKPQKDKDGIIQMWIGTSTDINDIKEMDDQKDFFISMASHELKTPITSVKGYVQLLQSKYKMSEDVFLTNSLSILNKQVGTLSSLITDLLDVSKIKSGSLLLKKTTFKINELVEDVIGEIQNINTKHHIIFLAEEDVEVFADKDNITQVLVNFLTNAIKYSPDSLNVEVKSSISNNLVTISVTDKGIGLKEADRKKVFERFYRVEGKNEKTFPGFGIGLFIASEIIKKHDGLIGVNSKLGEGSSFYFSLPLESNS